MATLNSGAGSQAGGSRKGTVSHGPSTAKELQAHGQQSHGRDRHNGEDSQLIFANLVETGRLGPAITTIFDRGWQDSFAPILESHVKRKDAEIRAICNTNYVEFIQSIDEMVKAKTDVKDLRNQISLLNQDVQTSGAALLEKAQRLLQHRIMLRNVQKALELCTRCGQVVALASKAHKQIEDKRYKQAIKTVDALRGMYLPSLSKYPFAARLDKQVPFLTLRIKDSAKADFHEWLSSIRDTMKNLGIEAMGQMDTLLEAEEKRREADRMKRSLGRAFGSQQSQSAHPQHTTGSGRVSITSATFDNPSHSPTASASLPAAQGPAGSMTSPLPSRALPLPIPPAAAAGGAGSKSEQPSPHSAQKRQLPAPAPLKSSASNASSSQQLLSPVNGGLEADAADAPLPFTASTSGSVGVTIGTDALLEQVNVDLTPVWSCMSTFESLNNPIEFQNEYREKRKNQLVAAIELSVMPNDQFLKRYAEYLAQICGFFLVEEAVMKSGHELVTRQQLDSMWDLGIARVSMVFADQLALFKEPADFRTVKYTALLFSRVLESAGFCTTSLLDSIASQRERFESSLFGHLRRQVEKHLSEEKCEPLLIRTAADYQSSVVAYGLAEPNTPLPAQYPTSVAFSPSVPRICHEVKVFIEYYYDFARMLNTDMEPYLRKAVDDALSREVNGALNAPIEHSAQLPISLAVQTSINAGHLSTACAFFENYTMSLSDNRYPKGMRLGARDQFQQTRIRCEDLIFELIDRKIESLLALAGNVKWNASAAQNGPSDYIIDLISYLSTVFHSLAFMSQPVREAVHFTSCKHIAAALMSQLMDNVKSFNIMGIYNLSLDLDALEQFARDTPLPNLVETFSELRQVVTMFLTGNIDELVDQRVREGRYPHLSLDKIIKLLEKYRDVGLFATLPPHIRKLKAKTTEGVAKRLREIAQ